MTRATTVAPSAPQHLLVSSTQILGTSAGIPRHVIAHGVQQPATVFPASAMLSPATAWNSVPIQAAASAPDLGIAAMGTSVARNRYPGSHSTLNIVPGQPAHPTGSSSIVSGYDLVSAPGLPRPSLGTPVAQNQRPGTSRALGTVTSQPFHPTGSSSVASMPRSTLGAPVASNPLSGTPSTLNPVPATIQHSVTVPNSAVFRASVAPPTSTAAPASSPKLFPAVASAQALGSTAVGTSTTGNPPTPAPPAINIVPAMVQHPTAVPNTMVSLAPASPPPATVPCSPAAASTPPVGALAVGTSITGNQPTGTSSAVNPVAQPTGASSNLPR